MKVISVMVLFVLLPAVKFSNSLHRSKRYLPIIFPKGGTFKLVIGVGIPVKLGSKQSMAVGWNFQFQYIEPTNTSQLLTYPPVLSERSRDKRESRRSDRAVFYSGIEGVLNSEGIDGRACILRSICENAADSTFHEANGLYGHLLHIALTPDYGDGEIDPDLDPIYLEAQKAGEYGVECDSLYSNCNYGNGLLDLFTIVENDLERYTDDINSNSFYY